MSDQPRPHQRSCSVAWCAEPGLHELHQRTLGTWLCSTIDGEEGMTVQLVIFSSTAQNVRPALVLVNNRLERVGAEMTWPDLLGLVAEVAIAARQYTDV